MKNQAGKTARGGVPKNVTTPTVVAKVQSVTATRNDGRQAPWTSSLQRTVDKRAEPAAPGRQPRSPLRTASNGTQQPANDNKSNQRNPNHEQYHKSRGLPGRPEDWNTRTPAPASPPSGQVRGTSPGAITSARLYHDALAATAASRR